MSSIYACDFSDISDGEIVTATQLLEDSIKPDAQDVGLLFCDISDYDLVNFASQAELTPCDLTSKDSLCNFSGVIQDENIKPQVNINVGLSRPFRNPVSSSTMADVQSEKFAKRTVDKSVWAVTLFGNWRAQRNVRCMYDNTLVYLDKPLGIMSDEELVYAMPLFLTEVMKVDGSEYPPATLRDLLLSVQKHLEINGRHVQFLNDEKFRPIRDTLDGLMKQRARSGIGLGKRQAEVSLVAYIIHMICVIFLSNDFSLFLLLLFSFFSIFSVLFKL